MAKYREILRLSSLGLSQQDIAASCSVSRKTVNKVLKRAKEFSVSWPLSPELTDSVLAEKFNSPAKAFVSDRKLPDYAKMLLNLTARFLLIQLALSYMLQECS